MCLFLFLNDRFFLNCQFLSIFGSKNSLTKYAVLESPMQYFRQFVFIIEVQLLLKVSYKCRITFIEFYRFIEKHRLPVTA
jgi:hypothetical protein